MKISVGSTLLSASTFCVIAVNALDCPCGFKDPLTNALWTDSVITYFNESTAEDSIVFQPSRAPSLDGSKTGGDTGSSLSQDWAALQHLNDYNDGFSNLWRTGYATNNTHLPGQGPLQLDVQPADTRDRVTWGAALLTRRRDIQFGSLRASLKAPDPFQGGTILQFGLQYNSSEYIRSSLYSASTGSAQSTLQWAYSARDEDPEPYAQNLSAALGASPWSDFIEHRIDWIGAEKLAFSFSSNQSSNNSGTTASLVLEKERDHTNLPSLGGPVSLAHFSSGDSSLQQSPPEQHQPSASVLYARIFFNSSLSIRKEAFQASCAAAPGGQTCSTEDHSLRGSTSFPYEALSTIVIPPQVRNPPMYSIVACSVAGGLFVLLLAHALAVRSLSGHSTGDSGITSEAQIEQPSAEDFSGEECSEPASDLRGRLSTDPARWEGSHAHILEEWLDEDAESEASVSDDEDDHDPLRIGRRPITLMSFGHGSFSGSHGSGGTAPLYALPLTYHAEDSTSSQKDIDPHRTVDSKEFLDEDSASVQGSSDATPSSLHDSYDSKSLGNELSCGASFNRQLSFSGDLPAGLAGASGGGFAGIGQGPQAATEAPSHYHSSVVANGAGQRHAVRWDTLIVEWQPLTEHNAVRTAGQMAQRKDSCDVARVVTPREAAASKASGWFVRCFQSLFVGEGAGSKTASGAARVEYLDGLRGFACFLVSMHHFMLIFYYGTTTIDQPMHYPGMETWLRRILGAVLVNGGLNVGIFFCLAARVIANRYLVRGRLQDLAEAIHRRVPRLMLPISAAILMNYFLIEADAFHWVRRLASRTWSPWSYYQDYSNLGVFINDYLSLWFTVPPSVPPLVSLYATGILWTVPVIVQSSWTVFLCALVAREIPSATKRYAFYATCWVLSWYANRFDYFFLAGLIIADLDNRLKYRQRAVDGIALGPRSLRAHFPDRLSRVRLHGQVIAWIIFLSGAVMSWLEFIGGPGSHAIVREHGIHPNLASSQPNSWSPSTRNPTYTDPRFFDFLFVIGFFLLCDLCKPFRTFFQLRFWSAFGRNAFSLYLLHGVIFWSWGAWLCLALLSKGLPYWITILLVFLTSYAWLALVCEMFTRTFDAWGVGLSKSFWRATSGGLGRRS